MKLTPLLRGLTRIGALVIAGTFAVLVGVQYARIIERNVAYVQEEHQVRADIAELQAKRADQLREIKRLQDPAGAIPEIHDRLHLVGDHEAIIYLKRPNPGIATP